MIVSDEQQFVFLHIPKCAGTTIRKQLKAWDSTRGAFATKGMHPQLGYLDYSHIPLIFLERHFFDVYQKLSSYRSYALLRNPYDRFVSAVLQRLREFRQIPHSSHTPDVVIDEAQRAIDWLICRHEFYDPRYIHFARQDAFVRRGPAGQASELFRVDDLRPFAALMSERHGIPIDSARTENLSFVGGNMPLRVFQKATRPVYGPLLGNRLRAVLVRQLYHMGLNTRPASLYRTVIENDDVRQFIEDYYSNDILLYRAAGGDIAIPSNAITECV